MKILFVAVFTPNSTNVSQSEGFKQNDCEVYEYDYRQRLSDLKNNQTLRDDDLIKKANEWLPDLVVFSKCNQMHFRVIDECNRVSKSCLWYMDPIDGNFNSELISKIERCSFVTCAIWDSYLRCLSINKNTHFINEGYDNYSNYKIDIEYNYDVSFIGTLKNNRGMYKNILKFDVINDAYGIKHSEVVSSSRINLNFTEGGTSDRLYKILASEGFLLTEYYPMIEKDFTIGEDLVVFDGVEDLRKKIEYYLNNEDERLRISKKGYETVQKFDRINWAKKLIDLL